MDERKGLLDEGIDGGRRQTGPRGEAQSLPGQSSLCDLIC